MQHFQDKLIANIKAGDSSTANIEKWKPESWPKEAKGFGFTEAPRGALAHWIKIKDGKIDNYQCVVPTTWNGSPRDPKGNIGAFEASLMDTPMADPQKPLEILRTIHSFDPCLACSTHVMSRTGRRWRRSRCAEREDDMTEATQVLASLDSARRKGAPSSQSVYVYEAPVRIWHWVNAAGDRRAGDRRAISSPRRCPRIAGRGERAIRDGLHPIRAFRGGLVLAVALPGAHLSGPSSATSTRGRSSTLPFWDRQWLVRRAL